MLRYTSLKRIAYSYKSATRLGTYILGDTPAVLQPFNTIVIFNTNKMLAQKKTSGTSLFEKLLQISKITEPLIVKVNEKFYLHINELIL